MISCTGYFARHHLNAQNVNLLTGNVILRKTYLKKYLGESIWKEVVIIRMEVIFLRFTEG